MAANLVAADLLPLEFFSEPRETTVSLSLLERVTTGRLVPATVPFLKSSLWTSKRFFKASAVSEGSSNVVPCMTTCYIYVGCDGGGVSC